MGCLACGRGFCSECRKCKKGRCHKNASRISKLASNLTNKSEGRGAPAKDPDNIKDRHSTGRKRAALIYPLFKNKPCEWRGKKNCGGGRPIVGCISGVQEARHHGPVKDTLRNEPGNVHRICTSCHNRWHAQNDPHYNEEEYEKLPHKPEEELATELELQANEMYWRMNKKLLENIDHGHNH